MRQPDVPKLLWLPATPTPFLTAFLYGRWQAPSGDMHFIAQHHQFLDELRLPHAPFFAVLEPDNEQLLLTCGAYQNVEDLLQDAAAFLAGERRQHSSAAWVNLQCSLQTLGLFVQLRAPTLDEYLAWLADADGEWLPPPFDAPWKQPVPPPD